MDIVLNPEWIFFQGPVELKIVVFVIGIAVAVVLMIIILTHGMFGKAMRRRLLVALSHIVPHSAQAL